ncbi:MAG: serine/threonine protein kinase, partial [Polyangiaceae bacterium]
MNAPPDFAGYRVLARLGHGGMADVYLASSEKQPGFTKLFVLKALKEDFKNDPEILAMFVQEAHIAARLNHAHVVQTYEVGTANDLPFIAMEFLDGQALNTVIRRLGTKLPLDMYMRVLSDVLSGLHYAHELVDFDDTPMGIVHRDVSPHNVFVTYDGVVKVLDFGIAKVASAPSITRTGVLKGKVSYMPREQVLNKNVDRRADIFAVGVMMFEVLSGKRMVKPGTPDVTVLQRRMAGEDPAVREAAANAPKELVAIAEKALRPEASERFATAEEMQLAIEEYLRGSSNPQPRDVGRILRDSFGEERANLKKTIEAQLSVPTPAIETIPLGPVSGSVVAGTDDDARWNLAEIDRRAQR